MEGMAGTPGAAVNPPTLNLVLLGVLMWSRCGCAEVVPGSQFSAKESLAKGGAVRAKIGGALSFRGESASTPTSTLLCHSAGTGVCVRQQFCHMYQQCVLRHSCFLLQTSQPGAEHRM